MYDYPVWGSYRRGCCDASDETQPSCPIKSTTQVRYRGRRSSSVHETWSGTEGTYKTNGTERAVYSSKLTEMNKLFAFFNTNCQRVGSHNYIGELHHIR